MLPLIGGLTSLAGTLGGASSGLSSLTGSLGGASSGLSSLTGSLGGASSLFGGGGGTEAEASSKSAATGTFSGGSLTVTKTDPTLIVALLIGGLLLFARIRKGRG